MNNSKVYQKDWFILIAIYILALITRIVGVYVFSWNRGPHFENYQIAQYIVDGKGYWWDWNHTIPPQPTALLPPIYTYFLVFFMKIFDNPCRLIYIVQSFLNALIVLPAFYLGKHLGSKKAGIIAACLFAFFPEVAIEPAKLISEPLFTPCIILAFYLFLIYKERLVETGSYRQFIWLGILLGITTLIKTTASLVALACFASLFFAGIKKKKYYLAIAIMFLGFFIATFPWNLRNLIVMEKPMLFTSNFGYNLWRGNHPWGSGTGYLDSNNQSEAKLSPEYLEYLEKNRPQTETELDKFYLNEALRFIKDDPKMYASRTLKRMLFFITIDPTHPLTRNALYI
ncbi:MAG: glycosyltransferase family 39 protein [candidate division Zixibacteria bacterium]|nr:glycosyltransferase family 39 protein [candidate division Zixibacteria bacterium]